MVVVHGPGRKSNDGSRSGSYAAGMDMIRGAKILRDRFEELHGVSSDAEPLQQIPEHASPLQMWTGTRDPEPQVAEVESGRRRWRSRNRG